MSTKEKELADRLISFVEKTRRKIISYHVSKAVHRYLDDNPRPSVEELQALIHSTMEDED